MADCAKRCLRAACAICLTLLTLAVALIGFSTYSGRNAGATLFVDPSNPEVSQEINANDFAANLTRIGQLAKNITSTELGEVYNSVSSFLTNLPGIGNQAASNPTMGEPALDASSGSAVDLPRSSNPAASSPASGEPALDVSHGSAVELPKQDMPAASTPTTTSEPASNASATSCPFCEVPMCVAERRNNGPCMSLFDHIHADLAHWKKGSVSLSLLRDQYRNGHKKTSIIHWNGKDRLQVLVKEVRPNLKRKGMASSHLLLGRLIADLLHLVQLPPLEIVFRPMDNCHSHTAPIFCLAKRHGDRAILIPNIVRPGRPRRINGSLTWGHDFAVPATPFEKKKNRVFYRGSLVGTEGHGSKYKYEPKIDIVCMGRYGIRKPACAEVDVGAVCPAVQMDVWKPWPSHYCRSCKGEYVPFFDGAPISKYLAIPQGGGYTGRMKDYFTFGSLGIKMYKSALTEHFERGMVHGRTGHVLDVSGLRHNQFLEAVDWACSHQADSKRMAERANAHVRWALSDQVALCYMWVLLDEYIKVLGYNPSKLTALAQITKGSIGEDMSLELKGEVPPLRKHHYETSVKPPSKAEHEKFVRTCKNLKYPREAEPG